MADRDSAKDLLLSFVALLLLAAALAGGAYMLGNFCVGLFEAHEETQRSFAMRRRGSSGMLVILSGTGAGLCGLGAIGVLVLGVRYDVTALFKRRSDQA